MGKRRVTLSIRSLRSEDWSSSRQVRDISLELSVDASAITWVAVANSLKGLLAPLLSRFQLVLIDEPTIEQRLSTTRAAERALSAGRDHLLMRDLPCLGDGRSVLH